MKNVDFKSRLAHQRKSPKSKDLGLFSNFFRKFLERWNGPFASIQQASNRIGSCFICFPKTDCTWKPRKVFRQTRHTIVKIHTSEVLQSIFRFQYPPHGHNLVLMTVSLLCASFHELGHEKMLRTVSSLVLPTSGYFMLSHYGFPYNWCSPLTASSNTPRAISIADLTSRFSIA